LGVARRTLLAPARIGMRRLWRLSVARRTSLAPARLGTGALRAWVLGYATFGWRLRGFKGANTGEQLAP